MQSTPTVAEKAILLKELHTNGDMLILPNVWDVASARLVAEAGFPVVATASAAIAFAHGYKDGEYIPRDRMLAAVGEIAKAVALPVTADLEAGYGTAPDDVANTVRLAIAAGIAGANIEDYRRDPAGGIPEGGIIEHEIAISRIAAARAAADEFGIHFVINARTDAFLHGRGIVDDPLAMAIERGNAFFEAGADCVFVPGVADAEIIQRLAEALNGPLNILVTPACPPLSVLKDLGVGRASFGPRPYFAAIAAFRQILTGLAEGTADPFPANSVTFPEMMKLMER